MTFSSSPTGAATPDANKNSRSFSTGVIRKKTHHCSRVSYLQGMVSYSQSRVSYSQGRVSYSQGRVSYLQGRVSYSQDRVSYSLGWAGYSIYSQGRVSQSPKTKRSTYWTTRLLFFCTSWSWTLLSKNNREEQCNESVFLCYFWLIMRQIKLFMLKCLSLYVKLG